MAKPSPAAVALVAAVIRKEFKHTPDGDPCEGCLSDAAHWLSQPTGSRLLAALRGEVRDDCAAVADSMGKAAGTCWGSFDEGEASGADKVAAAIRALKAGAR
jgi:hypothetical protein